MDEEKTDKTQLIVVFRNFANAPDRNFANAPDNFSQGHSVPYSLHMVRPRLEPYSVQ